MFDQMLFTWAPRGVSGPGFQPVAVTAGLADPASGLAQQAARFCRYARPAGVDDPSAAPVSYGWAAVGRDRFVFRRGYLGRDATGLPGNFYAHIVVGPVEEASVTELASRFDSAFWWRGEPVRDYLGRFGGRLAPVPLAEVPPARLAEVGADELAAFTDAVFHTLGAGPVVLRRAPAMVVALVGALSGRLPGALERLSVSTYEHPDTAGEYDIVGIGNAPATAAGVVDGGRGEPSGEARRARRIVLSTRRDDQLAVAISLAASVRDGHAALSQVAKHLRVFGDRPALVAALLGRDMGAWLALASAAPRLPAAALADLAANLGRAAVNAARPRTLAYVLGWSARMPGSFGAALVSALLSAARAMPERLAGLDGSSTVELLRACRTDPGDNTAVVAVLLAAQPEVCLVIADAPDLPDIWRARALAHRLGAGDEPEPVLQRLLERPVLIGLLVRFLPDPGVLSAALRRASATTAPRIALHAAQSLPAADRFLVLYEGLQRLGVTERPGYLARALTEDDAPGWWEPIVAAVVGDVVDLLVRNEIRELDPSVPAVLRRVGEGRCGLWLRILDGTAEPAEVFRAARRFDDRHRMAAIRLTLLDWLDRRPGRAETRTVVYELASAYPRSAEQIAQLLMDTCLLLPPGAARSPLPYLLFLLERINDGALAVRRNGRLRDVILQQTTERVVGRLSPAERQIAGNRATIMGGRAYRWWKTTAAVR